MSNTALPRAVAEVVTQVGQIITHTLMDRAQRSARGGIIELIMGRFFLSGGALANGFFGTDCLATMTGDLAYSIAPGMGFFYDSTVTDEFTTQYRPIVVPSAATGSLGAHDASNPRIDILCLAPATTDDTSESVSVRSGGSVSTVSQAQRRLYYRAVQVVAGTPAGSPSAPSTPSGYIKIAQIAVPAAAGAGVLTDTRPLLTLAQGAIGVSAIVAANIASDAVTTAKILDANVTNAKLAGSIAATKMATVPQYVGFTVNAESSNTITVDIQVKDADGNNISSIKYIELQLKTPNGQVLLDGTSYTLTIGATGTEVVETNDPASGNVPYMLLTTNGSGVAQVVVTDIVTGANRGIRIFGHVMGVPSGWKYAQCPFN